jgi:hypothetical protein
LTERVTISTIPCTLPDGGAGLRPIATMLEKKFILENLQKSYCYRCGTSLEGAKLVTITEAPIALVAHAVCNICKAESMITITPAGSGIVPVQSDLTGEEFKRFIGARAVSYDELLDLHTTLKKRNIWNLLVKKEKKSVNKSKA